MRALVVPEDIPGLVTVYFDDGTVRHDVTMGQLHRLAMEGWVLKPVPTSDWEPSDT